MKKIIITLFALFVLTNTVHAQGSATKEIKDDIARVFTVWLKKSEFETNADYEKRVKMKSEETLKKITEKIIEKKTKQAKIKGSCYLGKYNAENSSFEIEPYNMNWGKSQMMLLEVNKNIAKRMKDTFIDEIKVFPISVEINEKDEWEITNAYIILDTHHIASFELDSNLKLYDPHDSSRKFKELDLRSISNLDEIRRGYQDYGYIYYSKWNINTQPNYTPTLSKPIAFSLEDLNITLPATLTSSSSSAVTKSDEPDLDSNKIGGATIKNPNAVAVVIGNKEYENTKKVNYAINDAAEVKNYLIKALGYSEGNIIFLENAKKSNLDIVFGTNDNPEGKLFNSIKQGESDVFIYYSGHGAPGLKDNKGYVVPVDCDPNYIEQTGYSLDLFYKNLAKLNAKSVTVVADACFSGAELYKNISPITITVSNPIVLMPNCVVLSSSTGAQVSSWFNEKNHGLFTYFFLRAFQEKEKVDEDKNNVITFKELASYISDKTQGVPSLARRLHNVDQNPTIQGTGVENNFLSY
jgi:hypothetical protein